MKKSYVLITSLAFLLASCGSVNSSSNSTTSDDSTDSGSSDSGSSDSGSTDTRPDKPGDGDGSGGGPGGNGGGNSGGNSGGGGSSSVSYTAVKTYSEDASIDDLVVASTGADENAVLVEGGATVTFNNPTLSRTNSSSTGGDNSSFYGVGATFLNINGTSYLNGGTFTGDAKGAAGIFSYDEGITYVQDATITTSLDTSGGIHVAGGGTLYAYDLDVTTEGGSSAAIRSDRGSGTMVVDGGTYTSNGSGSPAIYSTADITVSEATLKATGNEAICIEGLNSIRLFDSYLEGNMKDDSQNDTTWNITVYQSQSGDSVEGKGTFEMIGGTLKAKNGGMFYTTNTESDFLIEDVTIDYGDDPEFLLQVTGNQNARGWGSSGSNGADTNFTARNQELEGNILYDSISTLDMYLVEGSSLKGAFIDDESYTGGTTGSKKASLYVDSTSSWVVTEDSSLSNLYLAGSLVDASGNAVKVVDSSGNTLRSGTSSITVTVSSFSTTCDTSDAIETPSYSDYKVSKPSCF